MFFFCYLLMILFSLLGVAFLTLGERKILGILGKRLGPNFISHWGVLQPFSDFLKLFIKMFVSLGFVDLFFWFMFPFWGLMLYILLFLFMNVGGSFFFFFYGFLFFFCVYSLLVYMFMFGGWTSKSKFSLIASMRVVVQMISYEVGYVFMFLLYLFMVYSFDYLYCGYFKISMFWEFSVIFFMFWVLICLAELSRSPFDFLEGESELVSGFNLEYGGLYFSLIFLVEYGFLMIISLVSSEIFFGSEFFFIMFLVFFIFVRGIFPRLRYDKMMMFFWSDLLVFFFFLFFYVGVFF